jgi:hypothetical protein
MCERLTCWKGIFMTLTIYKGPDTLVILALPQGRQIHFR